VEKYCTAREATNGVTLITPVYYYSKVFSVIMDWDHWKNKDPVFPEDALIWFTDAFKANSGTGA